jgi:Cupin domain
MASPRTRKMSNDNFTKPSRKTSQRAVAADTKKASPSTPSQRFNVNHFRADAFRADGLRSYAMYRDLGMSEATNGLLQAHVIRLIPPCDPAVVSKRHYHDVNVQMIYVLKGWIRTEFEGQGEVTMGEGTAWLQPPRIKHSVLDYSDDCELLEIISPARFDTVELE